MLKLPLGDNIILTYTSSAHFDWVVELKAGCGYHISTTNGNLLNFIPNEVCMHNSYSYFTKVCLYSQCLHQQPTLTILPPVFVAFPPLPWCKLHSTYMCNCELLHKSTLRWIGAMDHVPPFLSRITQRCNAPNDLSSHNCEWHAPYWWHPAVTSTRGGIAEMPCSALPAHTGCLAGGCPPGHQGVVNGPTHSCSPKCSVGRAKSEANRLACPKCLSQFPHDVWNWNCSWRALQWHTLQVTASATPGATSSTSREKLYAWTGRDHLDAAYAKYSTTIHECSECRDSSHGAKTCPKTHKA